MSNGDELREQLAGQVRVLRIIVAAITLGPVAYLGFVLVTAAPVAQAGGANQTLAYVAYALAAAAVAARLVAPMLIGTRLRRQIAAGTWPPPAPPGGPPAPTTDAGKLCAVYLIRTIIAIAILEGATFFLIFVYQQQRDPLALGAAALLTLGIALHFPSPARVIEWVERQLEKLDEDRQVEQFRRSD